MLIGVLIFGVNTIAQDIEQVKEAKPVSVGGGINFSSNYYKANGIENRQPSFFWTANANLNFTFFGVVDAPFSFNYSPQSNDLSYPYQRTQPFNQMGVSPSYKGITVHLGYRSMNFSKYSYSGNRFLGFGAEIKPQSSKVEYAFMFGRLSQALNDTLQLNSASGRTMSGYNRYATALKIGYTEEKGDKTELVIFKSWDDKNSLLIPFQYVNPPKDNFVLSINTQRKITKRLMLNVEYSSSGMTRDIAAPVQNGLDDFSFVNNLRPVFKYRSSSTFSSALKSSINYNFGRAQLKFGYRRIAADYESLGVPFINNDVEDITAGVSWRMLKNKMNINTTGGLQRNNLDRSKSAVNKRIVGSLNTTYAVSKKLNLMANVSNFNTSVSKVRIAGLDSLNYYQVTNNITGGLNYQLKNSTTSIHSLSGRGSYQGVKDIQENNSKMYLMNAGYNVSLPQNGFTSALMISYNINSFQGLENPGFGPTISLSKELLNKTLRLNVAASQLIFNNEGSIVDKTENVRISVMHNFKKKHSTTVSYNLINKVNINRDIEFTESRVMVQYGYNFSL